MILDNIYAFILFCFDISFKVFEFISQSFSNKILKFIFQSDDYS